MIFMLSGFVETLPSAVVYPSNMCKASALPQSLDARYAIQTAHLTVARLRQPLADIPAYLEIIEKYRPVHFGVMQVRQLELVYNDWYQRAAHTQKLAQFALGSWKTM